MIVLSVAKIKIFQIFGNRSFRKCTVLGAFQVKINRYHAILCKKHSYNHVGWTGFFSKRESLFISNNNSEFY